MRFDIKVKLKLDFLGEGWEECFINYSALTIKQAKQFRKINPDDPDSVDKGIDILKDMFLDGKGLSDGKLVDLKKEDIEDLPIVVINRSIEQMVGNMNDVEKKTVN